MSAQMKRLNVLTVIIFVLSFCSIVYELTLAQALSAFLENTVLRYSVTIGLYMFSMGLGALFAEGKFLKMPVLNLLRVEIFLTIVGGFSICILHLTELVVLPRFAFSLIAHLLIFGIGIFTGFELPLLIAISEDKMNDNVVLGINYAGAFFGTLVFAFVFYASFGLMTTVFFVGMLNAICGILLYSQHENVPIEQKILFHKTLSILGCVCVSIIACLMLSQKINQFFINQYLG